MFEIKKAATSAATLGAIIALAVSAGASTLPRYAEASELPPVSSVESSATPALEVGPQTATSLTDDALLRLGKVHRARPVRHRRSSVRWRKAKVSWYGPGLYGNGMAGGGRLTPTSMIVAHRTLPFGTRVQIMYKGRAVVAVVKDRGPYVSGRTFDLGPGTAKKLRFKGVGTVKYRVFRKR